MHKRLAVRTAAMLATAFLAGCATPPASEPRGKWRPVNHLPEVTRALPLNHSYVYQVTPIDGTLKGLLTRWAKDGELTLSYLHPNDYTLFAPVAEIRTYSLTEAAAALSSAYASHGVVVTVERSRIVVSYVVSSADSSAAAEKSGG